MYRKSKWKCGYNLAVLGHGEFPLYTVALKEHIFLLAHELPSLDEKFVEKIQ